MMTSTWRKHFVEALFRNIGYLDRNLIAICLGFIAAILLLSARTMPPGGLSGLFTWVSYVYAALVLVMLLVLFVVRPLNWDDRPNLFRWGVVTLLLLGFGIGALVYRYRDWFVWIWNHLENINTPPKLLLASLFLLGVIMGFFVVRNWSQSQNDFVKSLTAVFGGAFISTILGKLAEGTQSTADGGQTISTFQAFALYAGGFTLSGCVNLIVSAFLAANYSNRRSVASRALLDLLYGADKAKAIDCVFQTNFEDDKNYARALLTETVERFTEVVERRFAEKMDGWLSDVNVAKSPPSGRPACYQLDSIFLLENQNEQDPGQLKYKVRYKRVSCILPDMFRVAVSVKWQDNLEYITSPGEYKQPFPFNGSVAGMALLVRSTIVMARDWEKEFRTSAFPNGIWPGKHEQNRGLDELDYLSYIAVPVVGNFGKPEEYGLGILHVDTKLFVIDDPNEIDAHPDPQSGMQALELTREQIRKTLVRKYAVNLYCHNDKSLEYLENVRNVLAPVLQLYLKCRQGST
jgi:hypothetical protein